jgi:hypothetical protein
MTDGRNNRLPPEPKDEADLLKADNKTIIVVAIGMEVQCLKHLMKIAIIILY